MASSDDDLEIAAQSFVDDELLTSERLEFLDHLKNDDALRLRVSELLYQKELVRQAFSDIPKQEPHHAWLEGRSSISRSAVAAALMVLALVGVSLTGGVYVGGALQPIPHTSESSGPGMAADITSGPDYRLITENGVEMAHSLAQVADLLKAVHTQRGPVALLIDERALRSSKATNGLYAKRIGALLQEHPNLHLIACEVDTDQNQAHSLTAFSPTNTQSEKAFSLLSNC